MRTTFFTTQLQATAGHVHVFSTHQIAGIVQSSDREDGLQSRIETLHTYLTNEPPHTPAAVRSIFAAYASDLDVALLVHKENSLILATQGSGVIFLKRDGKLVELVGDGKVGQGPAVPGDEFILTSNEFLDLLSGVEGLEYYFLRYSSAEVVEMMKTYEDQSIASGFVAVAFGTPHTTHPSQAQTSSPESTLAQSRGKASTSDETEDDEAGADPSEEDVELEDDMLVQEASEIKLKKRPFSAFILSKLQHAAFVREFIKKHLKFILMIGIPLLIGGYLLLRNVFAPAQSRKMYTSIEGLNEQVESLLKEADTAAFVSVEDVEPLIAKARVKLQQVSEKDKRSYATQIEALSETIAKKEKEYLKINDATVSEHFDVSLDSKNAAITDADFDGTYFYLLDSKNGVIYQVGTEKRSYETIKSDKLKSARVIAGSGNGAYVLTASDGIYLITQDRSTRVIAKNSNWGTITDMRWYAGNLYLLDAGRKNIYKYAGISEDTFGNETSYLVEEAEGNLESNKRMAIDGSVYTAGTSNILKFTTGRKADFNLTMPYKAFEITALYASPDADMMYVFDGVHNALVELQKGGIYERQWLIPQKDVLYIGVTGEGHKFVVTQTSILRLEEK